MSRKVSDLTEYYVLRNVSARHLISAQEGKMSDLAIDGYMLVQLRLPAYLSGKNRHKANTHDGKMPVQPLTAICWCS